MPALLFATLFLLAHPSGPEAQTGLLGGGSQATSNEPVTFTADELEFDQSADTVIARGRVEAWQGLRVLRADEFRYNRTTGVATATGNVALIYLESPANPTNALVDVEAVAASRDAIFKGEKPPIAIDNTFLGPLWFQPLKHGADIVVYSATKHIDGQGRALGGAILGPADYINGPVKNLMRHTGPAMSPFNAWIMVKGLETLSLRVERQHDNALTVAAYLAQHPRVTRVVHPWLDTHPQHELARRQMLGGGTVVTFDLAVPEGTDPESAKKRTFAFLDALEVIDISNNLGDAKSLITHPATTTHRRIGPEGRAAVGIAETTVRLSVGLEDVQDLIEDLEIALQA